MLFQNGHDHHADPILYLNTYAVASCWRAGSWLQEERLRIMGHCVEYALVARLEIGYGRKSRDWYNIVDALWKIRQSVYGWGEWHCFVQLTDIQFSNFCDMFGFWVAERVLLSCIRAFQLLVVVFITRLRYFMALWARKFTGAPVPFLPLSLYIVSDIMILEPYLSWISHHIIAKFV